VLGSIIPTALLFSRHKGKFIIHKKNILLVGKDRGLKLPGSGGVVGKVVRLEIYRVKDSIGLSIIDSIS